MAAVIVNDKPTWTEQYRHECEARMVARMSKAQRLAYYELVQKYRGRDAVRKLSGEAKRQYEQMKK